MTTYRVNQKGDGDMSVVIIPAYKPDETLIEITDKLWAYGLMTIIVVDDGSGRRISNDF